MRVGRARCERAAASAARLGESAADRASSSLKADAERSHEHVLELPRIALSSLPRTAAALDSGVQSLYAPTTGPRYGMQISRLRRKSISSGSMTPRSDSPSPRSCPTAPRRRPAGWSRCCAARACAPRRSTAASRTSTHSSCAREQHAELVDAADDLLVENSLALLQLPVAARELVHRQHRVVARVIGVVHGRPVHDLAAFAMREVVRDRDRLAVRDQKAVERPGFRRPRAHARAGAGLQQIDRALRAEVVPTALRRQFFSCVPQPSSAG